MEEGSSWQVYLLAAGQGRRAGGPKAWRDCGGRPLLEGQLRFLEGLLDLRRVAVSIQESWLPRCRTLDARPCWVPVPPQARPLGALQLLMKAAPQRSAAFLYHVDMRVWEKKVFQALESALGREEAAVPFHENKRGHPVLLSARLSRDLEALDPEQGRLDVFLRGRRVAEVPVPFGCIHDNWNEAE